jgi:hypothetical protein
MLTSARFATLLLLCCAGLPTTVASQSIPEEGAPARAFRRSTVDASAAPLWTASLERSVDAGLAWLAGQQGENGSWTGDVGHKQGDRYFVFDTATRQAAAARGHMGVTALAGMAFLAGGHLPGRGRYGEHVARTLRYVTSHLHDSGLLTDSGTRMYSHAFATLFLAEVYGMARRPELRKAIEKATHLIVDCQNAHGAWRYNAFSAEADLSVTVCQLQALRAARNVGIEIPRSTIDRAVAYVRASQAEAGHGAGLFYYKIHGRGAWRKNRQFSINAAAVTALVSAGVYDKALLGPAVDFLGEEFRTVCEEWPHHFYFWYGNYYAAQALFHAEGVVAERCFQDYFPRLRSHLLRDQASDGRWRNDSGPGDAFSTAMACIVLQVPKQYLPILQR